MSFFETIIKAIAGHFETSVYNNFQGICCIDNDDQSRLIDKLETDAVKYYIIDGSKVFNENDFYREAAAILPLDPPLNPESRNWDAFTDSLWEGLTNLDCPRVAIIWNHVEQVVESSLMDLIKICIMINDVRLELGKTSKGEPMDLALFLLGHGASFKGMKSSCNSSVS